MKKITKILASLLALVLVLSFFGCEISIGDAEDGDDNRQGEVDNTSAPENQEEQEKEEQEEKEKEQEQKTEIQDKYDVFEPIVYTITNNNNSKTAHTTDEDTLNVDYRKFVDVANTTFDKDLAKLGIVLSTEMYSWANITYKINGEVESSKLTKILKFEDIVTGKIKTTEYEEDQDDLPTISMSHYDFSYKGQKYQIFFSTFMGTSADAGEWSSNFDVGATTADYMTDANSHKEWTNKENHKGFDVTANRSITLIEKYIKSFKTENSKVIVYISGHSRGAAVANLVGKTISDNADYKTFCYTFASATTTTAENAGNYKNIFNVVNEDDVVTRIVPSYMGFKRYGVDIVYQGNDFKTEWDNYANASYASVDFTAIRTILETYAPTRDSLYHIPDTFNDPLACEFGCKTAADAQKKLDAKKSSLSKIDWEKYIEFSEVMYDEETKSYGYKWKTAPALLMMSISSYFGGGNILEIYSYLKMFATPSAQIMPIISTFALDTRGIEFPHIPESYVVIVNSIK